MAIESDDLPYRSGFGVIPKEFIEPDKPSFRDQSDFSTLIAVRDILEKALADLRNDFDAFSVFGSEDPDVEVRKLYLQIQAKREAYRIIFPLFEMVQGTVGKVESILSGKI